MRLGHELLKVDAALRRVVDGLEEQIEQHGLAAPNSAVEVEPLRRRSAAPREGEQIAEPRLAVLRQPIGKQLQLLCRQFLRGVRRELALEPICR
jgi:hypothetical protein